MNRREGITVYILVVCTLLAGWVSSAAESFSGSWTIVRSDGGPGECLRPLKTQGLFNPASELELMM